MQLKNKKRIIIILAIIVLIIMIVFLWPQKRNVIEVPEELANEARIMTQEEKISRGIDPAIEAEVIKDSEGDFIYKINK